MKRFSLVVFALSGSMMAYAQAPCFGPACTYPDVDPEPGPAVLCVQTDCAPVLYHRQDAGTAWFAIAVSSIHQYPILGWSGPCMADWECPALEQQAYADLENTARRVNRVFRWMTP